jgi:dolichol kinase
VKELYINTAIMSGLFLMVFGLAELAYVKFKVKVEFTRKFVHIASGLLCMIFPVFIENKWLVLVLSTNFFILLLISIKFNFLKSINKVERKTYGSFLFPVTIFILYCFYDFTGQLFFYYLPLLIFALSDPMGALVGKKFPIETYTVFGGKKSWGGSLAFFVSALIICWGYFYVFNDFNVYHVILGTLIAFVGTIAEGVSSKGIDNVTVPLVVAFVLFFDYALNSMML